MAALWHSLHHKKYGVPCFIILQIILFMAPLDGKAQKADSVLKAGKKYQLYSTILHENRAYWVHLPAGYHQPKNADKHYPVIYALDGEWSFMPTVGMRSSLGGGRHHPIPETIIVGVINTNRTRDLTPSKAVSMRGRATLKNSGGGERFIYFMRDELMPQIDQQYRTASVRVLMGHSFGGLMVIYTLFHHTRLFTDYIALAPSFWWDDQRLLRQANRFLSEKEYAGIELYVAKAGTKKGSRFNTEEEVQSTFYDKLKQYSDNGLQWRYERYEEETHGTVFMIGSYYGLKYTLIDE